PVASIELVARATVTPGIPPPPAPPPPLPPLPPPPTLWFSEAVFIPPLAPGVLVVNIERDDDRPTSSAAPTRASAPRRGATSSSAKLANFSLKARMPAFPRLVCGWDGVETISSRAATSGPFGFGSGARVSTRGPAAARDEGEGS